MYLQDPLLKWELLDQRVCILFILTNISKLYFRKTAYFQVTLPPTVDEHALFSIHLPRLCIFKIFQYAKLISV